MATDLYDDGGSEAPSETTDKPDKEGAATGLLPKSFFGDKSLEKGTRCEVEVAAVYDDQVEVKKVPKSEYKDEDDTHTMPDGSEMKNSEMDEMME